jgi:hypothetical protein
MPVRYDHNSRGWGQLLRSRSIGSGCERAAVPEAARIAAATPVGTGETRDSTRIEPYDFGDRRGAVIVQDGASVQQHYGNAVTRATHYAHRGR